VGNVSSKRVVLKEVFEHIDNDYEQVWGQGVTLT
jgi:hypothetical protein